MLDLQSRTNNAVQTGLTGQGRQTVDLATRGSVLADISKIVLTSLGEIHFFDPSDIVYCHANGNYTQFFLADGKKVMISKTLKEAEGALDPDIFLRIHKSYIINLQYIKRFHTRDHLLILRDGTELPVSQRRKAQVIRTLRGEV